MIKKLIIASATVGLLISLVPVASAVTCLNGQPPPSGQPCPLTESLPGGASDLLAIVEKVTNWIFTALLAVAVIFIILAAYKYLLSGGGEEVNKAHKMLIYAAIAVAVAVLAKGIVNVAKVLVGGGSGGSSVVTPPGPPSTPPPSTGAVPVPGTPVPISVYPCPDGQIPGVKVNGVLFGPAAGTYTNVGHPSPQVLAQRCSDGSMPSVIVEGVRYP